MHSPLSVGTRLTLQIETLDEHGRGLGYVQRLPIHVEGGLPGERVEITIVQTGPHFCQAEIRQILQPAAARVTAPCEYFSQCGGCELQHMSVQLQRHYKTENLRVLLQQQGVIPAHWAITPDTSTFHYRRRARLGVRLLPQQGVILGFRRRHHSHILNIHSCMMLDARVSGLFVPIRELIATLSIAHRIPQVELVAADEAIALVLRHLLPWTSADRLRLQEFAQQHQLMLYTQAGEPDKLDCVWQPANAQLQYAVHGERLYFSPTDFIQAHAQGNSYLVSQVIQLIQPRHGDTIADLFCGLGNFTLPMARAGARVLAMDNATGLIHRGNINARFGGLDKIVWQATDLYRPSAQVLQDVRECSKILLDPPRSGAIKLLVRLAGLKAQRLVYVSCDMKSFVRDAAYLVHKLHYRLHSIGCIDMFPHTVHTEIVALFIPAKADA